MPRLRRNKLISFFGGGAFPHIYVRSGYILGAIGSANACRSPPRTKPRCTRLGPKGSLSLTRMLKVNEIFFILRHFFYVFLDYAASDLPKDQ